MIQLHCTGLPHSEIHGLKVICTYPQLIAAYHVLHRLLEPRHPPFALICFFYVFARVKLYFYTCWVLIYLSKQIYTNSFLLLFSFYPICQRSSLAWSCSTSFGKNMRFFDYSKSQINFEFRVSDSKFRIFLTAKSTKLHETFFLTLWYFFYFVVLNLFFNIFFLFIDSFADNLSPTLFQPVY